MRTLRDYDDATWDRFFDFIYDDCERLPIEEVRRRLREAGIDMKPVHERLRKLIEERRKRPTP